MLHIALFGAFLLVPVTCQSTACQVCACTDGGRVDCAVKGLAALPSGIPLDTIVLDFGYNNLTTIKKDTFRNYTRLLRLNLEANQLSQIEPGGFIGLSNVISLILARNKLEKLDPDIMLGVGGGFGFYMRIDENKLKILSPLTFSGVATPYRITFQANSIEEIPPRLFYQNNGELTIFRLVFTENQIRNVAADAFMGVKYIQDIYFGMNRIASLPRDLFVNTTILGNMDLSSNELKSFPDGFFRRQSRLRALYLHRNFIRVLSKKMFAGLHSLRELIVSDNPITQIDGRVFSETQLVNLHMANAHLRSIGSKPFVTRNQTLMLVSLYGNSIDVISNSVWQDLGYQCIIFIDNTLRKAPYARQDLSINLVGAAFVHPVNVSKQTASGLDSSGFSCKRLSNYRYECTPCHQGFYGASPKSCRACPPGGFFQNRTGQVIKRETGINCLFCNNGTYVTPLAHPGRTIGDCTVCPSGTKKSHHAGYRACPCLANSYRKDRFGGCSPCPLAGINCSGEYQHLLLGFWWTWDWSSHNNFLSYKQFVHNIILEDDSYDRSAQQFKGALPQVHACPRKESCQNLGDGINATCQHGYTDFLCSHCTAGFYSWFDQCFECPRWWVFLLEVLAALVVIVVVIIIVVWDLRRHRRSGRSVVNVVFSRFKILLGFYQIMGEIFDALNDISWPKTLTHVGSFFKVLQVNIMQLIISPRCYAPNFTYPSIYIEFIAGLSFSVVVVMLALCVCGFQKLYLHVRTKNTSYAVCTQYILAQTKQKCYLVVVILLFVTYPSLSSDILTLLPSGCDEFYLDETNTVRASRLRSDYSIDCETNQHLNYNYAAEVSLCYVVGFPSALLLMLWLSHRRVRRLKIGEDISILNQINHGSSDQDLMGIADDRTNHNDNGEQTVHCNHSDQADHPNQRCRTDHGDPCDQTNSSDLTNQSSYLHHTDHHDLINHGNCNDSEDEDDHMLDTDTNNQHVSNVAYTRLNQENTKGVSWESFLCENYKKQFWYWEIVELARKILQIVFVLLFGADDHFTLFATIVLSVGFLLIHAYVKPMKDAVEHRLQMCSLGTIFLNLLAASLLLLPSEGSHSSEARKELLAVFLVLLNLSIVAFVVGNSIWTFVKALWSTACCSRALACIVNICHQLAPRRYRIRRHHKSHQTAEQTTTLISGRPTVQDGDRDNSILSGVV